MILHFVTLISRSSTSSLRRRLSYPHNRIRSISNDVIDVIVSSIFLVTFSSSSHVWSSTSLGSQIVLLFFTSIIDILHFVFNCPRVVLIFPYTHYTSVHDPFFKSWLRSVWDVLFLSCIKWPWTIGSYFFISISRSVKKLQLLLQLASVSSIVIWKQNTCTSKLLFY